MNDKTFIRFLGKSKDPKKSILKQILLSIIKYHDNIIYKNIFGMSGMKYNMF